MRADTSHTLLEYIPEFYNVWKNNNLISSLTQKRRLEQTLSRPKPLVANSNDLPIGQLVAFIELTRFGRSGHFLFEIEGDVC